MAKKTDWITLGKMEDGKDFKMDLTEMMRTGLLVQANSGGGKSYLVRKILEETHGKVQQIVIDIEGEFSTLREKFDYLLVGKNGDIEANPKTAPILAKKLLELNTSAIIDLYELTHSDRIRFVKVFLEALINAPKDLWHPVLIVLDEAHKYAGEREKQESVGAVIALAERGRKRGFGKLFATQRLAKLHKDVAAETNNKLIGRTGLDLDMRRAADELGFSKEDMLTLRNLEAGEFYAFGPALSRQVIKVRIGKVKTHHPEPGEGLADYKPEPSTKVKEILKKLTDLPQEAEKELKEVSALKARVRELEAQKKQPEPKPAPIIKGYSEADLAFAKKIGFRDSKAMYEEAVTQRDRIIREMARKLKLATDNMVDAAKLCEQWQNLPKITFSSLPEIKQARPITAVSAAPKKEEKAKIEVAAVNPDGTEITYKLVDRKALAFLNAHPDAAFSRVQIAVGIGYSVRSSGFEQGIAKLKSNGLIKKVGEKYSMNPDAISQAEEITANEDWKPSKDAFIAHLKKCDRDIMAFLMEHQDSSYTKEDIADNIGRSVESSGFQQGLAKLKSLELVNKDGDQISLNPELLEILA